MSTPDTRRSPASVPELQVCTADGRVFRFARTFTVGREQDCDLRLTDPKVSRRHLEVSFEDGRWRVRDLDSANGTFAGARRVAEASIDGVLKVSLGLDGPTLLFEIDPHSRPPDRAVAAERESATRESAASDEQLLHQYQERYFGPGAPEGEIGGRTRLIRRAFEQVQRRQKRRYGLIVGILALALAAAVGYGIFKRQELRQLQRTAVTFFDGMKQVSVDIARLERSVEQTGDAAMREQVSRLRRRLIADQSTYENYLKALHLYDEGLSREDRLILKVTREFGECDAAAPSQYMQLVRSYIKRWQSTDRYAAGIRKAREMNYTATIAEEFIKQGLPPQYFYLALQESGFNEFATGPLTYAGYAKGMWQFIPDTGKRYGLTIGPLSRQPVPDTQDDRHNWLKSTRAAAQHIKELYATDAQASDLLVMACYNWGEGRVLKLIRSFPPNPGERNFWKLLERYGDRVPGETYNYVFYIVSAAVIGEDPRLFGFPFDNPLGSVAAAR